MLAAEIPATPAPPDIPFEQVGVVLVALVTGLTAIIVAVIQRGSKNKAQTAAAGGGNSQPAITFVIERKDWEQLRDKVTELGNSWIHLDGRTQAIRNEMNLMERRVVGEVHDVELQIAKLEGRLGLD